MTIDDYLDRVLVVYETYPNWRIGQCHYNVLYDMRPELEQQLPEDLDPFFQDVKVPAYVSWLRTVWA